MFTVYSSKNVSKLNSAACLSPNFYSQNSSFKNIQYINTVTAVEHRIKKCSLDTSKRLDKQLRKLIFHIFLKPSQYAKK
jgi:hypothetical protein